MSLFLSSLPCHSMPAITRVDIASRSFHRFQKFPLAPVRPPPHTLAAAVASSGGCLVTFPVRGQHGGGGVRKVRRGSAGPRPAVPPAAHCPTGTVTSPRQGPPSRQPLTDRAVPVLREISSMYSLARIVVVHVCCRHQLTKGYA